MGYHLPAGKPPQYSPSHPGQLSILLSAGWEMSTSQSRVMLCGWGVKAGWLIPLVDARVGARVAGKTGYLINMCHT